MLFIVDGPCTTAHFSFPMADGSASSFSIVGERQSGQAVRDQNCLAATTISNMLKSCLGPIGMDKMLVDQTGEVTISNDGATILRMLQVEHPAAKMLVELSQRQDEEVGDGTTSVTLIAAELIRKGNDLIKLGHLHTATVINGFRLACREACRYVQEAMQVSVDQLGKESLINVARTALASKVLDANFFAPLAVEAVQAIKTSDGKYPIKSINILKSHGKSQYDTRFIPNGYALNCSLASQTMPKRLKGSVKVACLDFNLQRTRMPLGAIIQIDDPSKIEPIRQREITIILERLEKIIKAGAQVILTTKGIDDLCIKPCVEAGAMAVRRCKKEDLLRICRSSGATLVSSLANLEGEESFESSLLGTVEECVVEAFGDQECILMNGMKLHPSASFILRGVNEYHLEEMHRALYDSLSVIRRTLEHQNVVPGGGAVETSLSIYLENFATSIASREQMAIAEFGDALLIIPKSLAINCPGAIDLISKLRAHHYAAQMATPDDIKTRSLNRTGLDLGMSKVRDSISAGVLEPALLKIKALKLATEAAIAILRIDDMIVLRPEASEHKEECE